jgi:hypothetical protein
MPARTPALQVRIEDDQIRIGRHFAVSFQRTLRIPDDGSAYPLPPGLGRFPIARVEDHAARVPAEWRARGGVFIPMHQSEALWLAFDGAEWRPNAVQVGVGGINAISGKRWSVRLSARPQNYLVVPDQLWLDGIKAGVGTIRQFIAAPLGRGYTVEEQLTGQAKVGGMQIAAFDPKPGRFPDKAPRRHTEPEQGMRAMSIQAPGMGLGAGGTMRQKVYADPYGVETWDQSAFGAVFVHIVNVAQYEVITGRAAPPTPIDAKTYTDLGFPWFELYDEERQDLRAGKRLAMVKSVQEKGLVKNDPLINVPKGQVKRRTSAASRGS